MYKIPIGLLETKGHTACQIADHTESLLHQVGFTSLDLFTSINDSTNSGVLAGKYIIGQNKAGKCNMHRAKLILKHATGQAVRRQGGTVIDENKTFVNLFKVFHIFSSWLMSRKARSRSENLKNLLKKMV